jgi:hypothetical protein
MPTESQLMSSVVMMSRFGGAAESTGQRAKRSKKARIMARV